MNIAVFRVNQLGDSLVFLPVVQALRRLHPDLILTLWIDKKSAPLFAEALPEERLLTTDCVAFLRAWKRPWQMVPLWDRMRKTAFAASFLGDDQGSVAHALAYAAGGAIRVGSSGNARRFSGLTHAVPPQEGWSFARWNWEIARTLLEALGRREWPADPEPPDLRHLGATAAPRNVRPRIVVHGGARAAFRRWPLDRYAALAERLTELGDVVWVSQPDTAGPPLPSAVEIAAPATLCDLVALLSSSDFFVGNNSGPMHFAAALGLPGVVVTGPSSLRWDPQWHRDRWRVLRRPSLACQPCETLARNDGTCGNERTPLACLLDWSVDAVFAECGQGLRSAGHG